MNSQVCLFRRKKAPSVRKHENGGASGSEMVQASIYTAQFFAFGGNLEHTLVKIISRSQQSFFNR